MATIFLPEPVTNVDISKLALGEFLPQLGAELFLKFLTSGRLTGSLYLKYQTNFVSGH